jgi:hypothetical protein
MAVFIMQLLSFLLRVGLYSKNLSQCSLLATGDQTVRSPPPPLRYKPIVGVYFTALYQALASSRTRLLAHTQRRATVGRTPLNE